MILLIDNYDSFTYNLYQYLSELGAEVHTIRNDQVSAADVEALAPERVVISPGPCTPNEAGISVEVIERMADRVPILGVCLGHECIAVAFGGKIAGAGEIMHGKSSPISHDGKGVLRGLPDPFDAIRYHSLAVMPESVPETLEVTAHSDSGVIMGIRHRQYAIEGVQFHPESIMTSVGKRILQNFLEMS